MCKSQAEGGQRCSAHTRGPYEAATPGTMAWDEAAAQHASTPAGRKELEDYRDEVESRGDYRAGSAAMAALAEGDRLRRRNALGTKGDTLTADAPLPNLTTSAVIGADLRNRDLRGVPINGTLLASAQFAGAKVDHRAGNGGTVTLVSVEHSDYPIAGQALFSIIREDGSAGLLDARHIYQK